jgi:trehalose synthase
MAEVNRSVSALEAGTPQEVHLAPLSPERFKALLDKPAWERFEAGLQTARGLLEGRVVWNVNSTARGGGVAEMLRSFVSYSRGAGLDVRWTVISGQPEFFRITKRLHNYLHGNAGDGGELGSEEARVYNEVSRRNAEGMAAAVRPEDVVLLHDPQTAGLTSRLKEIGAKVVWRSHVGAARPNELVHRAWEFLAPQLEQADACVFSRQTYVPEWAHHVRTEVIAPSIDAFSPKNEEMDRSTQLAILSHVGLVQGRPPNGTVPTFTRHDGTPGRVDNRCEILSSGPEPAADVPLVTQVSRWDRLKDPIGVMIGFAEEVAGRSNAHLVLAGPAVNSVSDDPEGAQILEQTTAAWRELAEEQRHRVHLACIPMVDIEENAAIVNALQRHATVVVQKSIEEGFGLTVAEAMWKSRPVVASAVGGILEQIQDGVTGVLLHDPTDLRAFGEVTLKLLNDSELASTLGRNAHDRVKSHFLLDRHSLQYIRLFQDLLGASS